MSERDPRAFAAFYDRYNGRILGFLTRLMTCRGDAEDATQDAFWQVWVQSHRYDPRRGRPSAWLLMMARTRALDLLRRRRAARELEARDLEHLTLPPADERSEQREVRQVTRAALAALPPDQRLAVTLSFYHAYTHQEIAEITNTPLGTVKSRIRLGMGRLRELLEQDQSAA